MALAYLLARDGIDTTLLELHKDFARDFRGDTFHASSMELVEDLGLLDNLEPMIHARLTRLHFTTQSGREATMASFEGIGSKYPYVAIVPQADFLNMLAEEAGKFPSFKLMMQATGQDLIEESGKVVGIRYQKDGQSHELRADLVVGADGRGSGLRKKAGFELVTSAPSMDVVWFRLPREAGDPPEKSGVEIRIGKGTMMVQVSRGSDWQLGYIIVKGSFNELRQAGIEEFHRRLRELLPPFMHGRVAALDAWNKVAVLAVQVGRIPCWHKPGLLLIGDAAHVMSPIGGVGINYAIQDAIAAYNLLSLPLQSHAVTDQDLAAVQQRREWPTRVMQGIQSMAQKYIVKSALDASEEFQFPLPMRMISRIPLLRNIPASILAYGVRHERIHRKQ